MQLEDSLTILNHQAELQRGTQTLYNNRDTSNKWRIELESATTHHACQRLQMPPSGVDFHNEYHKGVECLRFRFGLTVQELLSLLSISEVRLGQVGRSCVTVSKVSFPTMH